MHKTLNIILLMVVAAALGGCKLHDINGDLDGQWQLLQVTNLSTSPLPFDGIATDITNATTTGNATGNATATTDAAPGAVADSDDPYAALTGDTIAVLQPGQSAAPLQRRYYCFQLHTVRLNTANTGLVTDADAGRAYCALAYDPAARTVTLDLVTPSRPNAVTRGYALYDAHTTFAVDRLDAHTLVLASDSARLTLRRY